MITAKEFSETYNVPLSRVSHWLRDLGIKRKRKDQGRVLDICSYWKLRIIAACRDHRGGFYLQACITNKSWLEETALSLSFFSRPSDKEIKIIITPNGVRRYRSKRQLFECIDRFNFVEVIKL